jgi:hypothetical protein
MVIAPSTHNQHTCKIHGDSKAKSKSLKVFLIFYFYFLIPINTKSNNVMQWYPIELFDSFSSKLPLLLEDIGLNPN